LRNEINMTSETANLLDTEIATAKKFVKADAYSMSIGEIISMYERDEVILDPSYQRYFRWSPEQKSKLIESVLIGLPLPSFFVATTETGDWEVVDGLQRLSTILDFMDVLQGKNTENNYAPFKTITGDEEGELQYLKSLVGMKWSDFSRATQLAFKRVKIQMVILARTNDNGEESDAKFELFQRLNTGGSALSGQELRNAILARDNPNMLVWLEKLSKDENFEKVTGLPPRRKSTRYDLELVLRFIVMAPHKDLNVNLGQFSSVDTFLTEALIEIIKDSDFDFDAEEKRFKKTFATIYEAAGRGALKYSKTNGLGSGKFSLAFFEAVALGIAQNIENLPNIETIKKQIEEIGKDERYRTASSAGRNTMSRTPKLLELGKEYFQQDA
jgi:hypothetical protein